MNRLFAFVAVSLMVLGLWACTKATDMPLSEKTTEAQTTTQPQTQADNQIHERSEFIYGTLVHVKIFERGSEEILSALFDRLVALDQLLSTTIETSDIYKINAASGVEPVVVSEETFKIIKSSLRYSELSDSHFDVTVEPLVMLWNIGNEGARVPKQSEIDQVLPLIDYRKIVLNEQDKSVYLPEKGMGIDLGAIAKGYAADEMIQLLKEAGVPRAIVNLGGNVIVLGGKTATEKWNIGIQNPESNRGEYLGIARVSDQTVVTSGIYERYFEENGKQYHHLLDTRKGYPVENNVASVSIISDISMDADALSTVTFTLGVEKGIALVETLEGVEVIFVTKDHKLYTSSGIKDIFELTDTNFEWVTQ